MQQGVRRAAGAVCGLFVGLLAVAQPALAWHPYHEGPRVYFGPPVFLAPPVYAPPPVYYEARPYPAAQTCYAGAYICPLDQPAPVGGHCACPTHTGRAFGTAR